MAQMGKLLIILGAVLVLAGVLLLSGNKLSFIVRLPGDILIKKENFSFYLPLTISILISVVLSLLFWIFRSK